MTALEIESSTSVVPNSDIDPRELNRVVSIHYYGRSGSIFLQSLLDSHPDVFMFPAVYLTGFYPFWQQFGDRPAVEVIAAFIQNYDVLFNVRSERPVIDVGPRAGTSLSLHRMGPNHDEQIGVLREIFGDALLDLIFKHVPNPESGGVERKFFFQAIHVAYAKALGRNLNSRNPVIVLQTHNPMPEAIVGLVEDFAPHLQFLHCVREPVQTMGSWFVHMRDIPPDAEATGPNELLNLPATTLGRALFHATPILAQRRHPSKQGQKRRALDWSADNSRAVRLEDLHTRPRETLEKMCAWLNIPWDACLMKSTFDGKLWHWTTGGVTYSGFQRQTISKRHADVLSWFDRVRLRFLLSDKFQAWDYPLARGYQVFVLRVLALSLWLLPFRMETGIWRRHRPLRFATTLKFLRHYLSLRGKVFMSWWDTIRARQPLIKLL